MPANYAAPVADAFPLIVSPTALKSRPSWPAPATSARTRKRPRAAADAALSSARSCPPPPAARFKCARTPRCSWPWRCRPGAHPQGGQDGLRHRLPVIGRVKLAQPRAITEGRHCSPAARSARGVLPTPPTPVTVTSGDRRISAASSASSFARPTNELSLIGRFPADASSASARAASTSAAGTRPQLATAAANSRNPSQGARSGTYRASNHSSSAAFPCGAERPALSGRGSVDT